MIKTAPTETDVESVTERKPKTKRLQPGGTLHRVRPVPALALGIEEAARACGVSPETFDRHVRPYVAQVPVSPGAVIFRPETIAEWLAKTEAAGSDPTTGEMRGWC